MRRKKHQQVLLLTHVKFTDEPTFTTVIVRIVDIGLENILIECGAYILRYQKQKMSGLSLLGNPINDPRYLLGIFTIKLISLQLLFPNLINPNLQLSSL